MSRSTTRATRRGAASANDGSCEEKSRRLGEPKERICRSSTLGTSGSAAPVGSSAWDQSVFAQERRRGRAKGNSKQGHCPLVPS